MYTSHTCWQGQSQWCFLRWLSRLYGTPEVYCSSTDEWRQGWEAQHSLTLTRMHRDSVCLMFNISNMMEENCSKANWVVYNICLFTAISFCIAAVLKVLHGNLLLLLLLLNTYLSQQIRNLAARPVIACLRDWKLPKWHNILNHRDIKIHPRDKIVIHGGIMCWISVPSLIYASKNMMKGERQ